MRVLLVSGSRADMGALAEVQSELQAAGHTSEGVRLAPPARDTRLSITITAANEMVVVASEISRLRPDLVMLHGDRSEILGAAVSAFNMNKPIAHLCGGDITEGSADDNMRHAITKLSSLHFVSCDESAKRVAQMGEEPWRIFTVGCPGVDSLTRLELPSKTEALAEVSLKACDKFVLATYHPNTTDSAQTATEVFALRAALDQFHEMGFSIAVTAPNNDFGSTIVSDTLRAFTEERDRATYSDEIDRTAFLALLKHCTVFVGNSSAGYYEAPTFGTPVISIGDRQKGRERPDCVIQCNANPASIMAAFKIVRRCDPCNLYGDGQSAKKIVKILGGIDFEALLPKKFIEWHTITPGTRSTKPNTGVVGRMSMLSGL